MPIEFHCSQCGKLLRTGDDTAGRQAQCPECCALTRVPDIAGAAAAPDSSSPFSDAGTPFAPVSEIYQPGDSTNPYMSPTQPGAAAPTDTRAVIALVLGCCGLLLWCCPLVGFPVTLTGLILGILSLKNQKTTMSILATVLCAIGLLLTVLNALMGVAMVFMQN